MSSARFYGLFRGRGICFCSQLTEIGHGLLESFDLVALFLQVVTLGVVPLLGFNKRL